MKSRIPWRRAALALVLTGGLAPAVSAHHPFSAVYAMDRRVTIDGEVVAIVLRHPHSYIHVSVRNPGDAAREWVLEWESHDDGRGPGGPMETLHVGDRVTATGYPGRDPAAFRLLTRMVTRRSDGWHWTGTDD